MRKKEFGGGDENGHWTTVTVLYLHTVHVVWDNHQADDDDNYDDDDNILRKKNYSNHNIQYAHPLPTHLKTSLQVMPKFPGEYTNHIKSQQDGTYLAVKMYLTFLCFLGKQKETAEIIELIAEDQPSGDWWRKRRCPLSESKSAWRQIFHPIKRINKKWMKNRQQIQHLHEFCNCLKTRKSSQAQPILILQIVHHYTHL